MSIFTINDQLVRNLRSVGHVIRFLSEGRGSQKRILILLLTNGGMTQQKLTERLGIRPGSVSEILSKLENMGYIARTPNEQDHRTTDIRLTEDGIAYATEAAMRRSAQREEMFSCLSDEEKEELLALLAKLNADWDVRYRDARQNHCHPCHEHCSDNAPPPEDIPEKHIADNIAQGRP